MLENLSGTAVTPAPLILELIKAVLTIGAVSIQLRDCLQIILGIGYQHRIFIGLCRLILEPQPELILDTACQCKILLNRAPQDHHTSCLIPATQFNRDFPLVPNFQWKPLEQHIDLIGI